MPFYCSLQLLRSSDAHHWLPGVTHVLTSQLSRSARTVAAMAAGNWLLSIK